MHDTERTTEIIQVSGLDYSYRKNHVLDHLQFTLPLGESIAILGANGSGKSTLLSILAGARRCPGAVMEYQGHDLLKETKLRSSIIGYVPQSDPLMPDMSVRDNLLLWYHGKRSDFAAALSAPSMQMLQLDGFLKKKVNTLSGGMRKRVSLATALINAPQILIMDEPAAALDLCYKAEMREYLRQFHKEGHTLILTTHDEEDLSIISVLYLLRGGQLQKQDRVLRGDELLREIRQ
ncbi:MAG: ABC transporter ATP-binding protein [Lachnospiraceae bacterium]|nr:ABC transporter ATP-binding protein [Lachnospiraceae bacterium]